MQHNSLIHAEPDQDDDHPLDFTAMLEGLNRASGFELYRLRAAIDRVLDQPHCLDAIRSRLRSGQPIGYFDPQANRLRQGEIVELRRKQAAVLDGATGPQWLIPYVALNVDGIDVEIRQNTTCGQGRHEVSVGDTVGFLDRERRQRSGQVVRLNDRTVTVICAGQKWRVSYALLHWVVEARSGG